jgi:hypothetical protein
MIEQFTLNNSGPTVRFIDENEGGPGVRLRKRHQKEAAAIFCDQCLGAGENIVDG